MSRKNRITIRDYLSNGQILTVVFNRRRADPKKAMWTISYPDTKIAFLWYVSIHIGNTPKEAKRWRAMDTKIRATKVGQTGNCGLEGLRRALVHVLSFCVRMGEREELQIICDDEKRYRAYRYLTRFNGFKDHGNWFAFRHPNWWHWKETLDTTDS